MRPQIAKEFNVSEAVDEFLNPKSMLTPAIAAGVVVLITGALWKHLKLHPIITALCLSFLVCTLLFMAKALRDPKLHVFFKGVLYALNSLIVWAMSVATLTASANENTPTVTQDRPFAVDWRDIRATRQNQTPTSLDPKLFKLTSKADTSGLTDFLARAGVIVPDYSVTMKIDPSQIPSGQRVQSVEWRFNSALIPASERVVVVNNPSSNFRVDAKAWKSFDFEALIKLEDGSVLRRSGTVNPAATAEK
jgi:hypothetical protein